MGDLKRTTLPEEIALAARIKTGDISARNELVSRNLPLVSHLVKYFRHKATEEDLWQEGAASMIRAAEKYDPTRGTRFSTYAAFWIRQGFESCMEQTSPVSGHRRWASGVDKREVGEQKRLVYLDKDRAVGSDSSGDAGETLQSLMLRSSTDVEHEVFRSEVTKRVRELVSKKKMKPRDRAIFVARYLADDDVTLDSVGKEHGICRERVRQIEARILGQVRKSLLPLRGVVED